MNILQIASNMKNNGPAMVVYDLSYGLAEMGNNVYIAAAYGELVEKISHPNIHYINLPTDRLKCGKIKKIYYYSKNCIKTYYLLKKIIKNKKIDIINSHQPISNIYAKMLSKNARIPFVTTSHNIYKKSILNKTYVSGDHVIACSDEVYKNSIETFNVKREKITCIRNGINPTRLKTSKAIDNNRKYTIGTLAGLREQKSLDNLIKSFNEFHKKITNSQLLIAGEGEEENKLKKLAKELKLNNSIIFYGFADNPADILSRIDIFALSSKYEGLPISLLEAMSMKVPVVATAVGGIPWLIKDNHNGMLCEYGNLEEMANKFYLLYNDKSLSKRIAEKGYDTIIDNYSYKKMAKQYYLVYENEVAKRN